MHCYFFYVLFIVQLLIADIDQCLVNNGGCEQVCINLVPDFQCDCNVGYTLNNDGYSCRGDNNSNYKC